FPAQAIAKLTNTAQAFLTLELSAGQMVEDVRLAVNGAKPVYFYGRMGGMIPSPQEIYEQINKMLNGREGK
ncbi:MAG TPA: 3-methyl-2-oxobutanoate dehydrogenase subunit beta, partial [Negativicutes bacterium]